MLTPAARPEPVKIVARWTRRWDGSTGSYDPVMMYEWHWSDGTTAFGHSCPRDEFLHLIEDGADLLNPTQALVKAAAARLADEPAGATREYATMERA